MSENIVHGVKWPRITVNTKVTITEDYIPMRDGVKLYTIVSVPLGAEKCPIVFIRTPYEHVHNGAVRDLRPFYINNQFILNGYAVVHQHCRGTGDSEGFCVPYDERNDGLDTLDFIRNLPCYNGEIYLTGGSYLSTVHLSYLDPTPYDIKGAALDIQTDRMFFRNYRNGMNYSWSNIKWWVSMMKRKYPEPNYDGAFVRPYRDLIKRIVGEDVPEYTATLLNDTYNDFWINDPRTNVCENLKIPVLFTDGWYDFYLEGMFSMWERLPYETRKKSAFVVGPWGHSTRLPKNPEYIPENGEIPHDYAVEWFNSIREKRPYRYAETGKVNYHSVGGGMWKSAEIPYRYGETLRLNLAPNNKLSLSNTSGSRTYTYDPDKPHGCFKYGNITKAHEIDTVEDVLSFVSDEFSEDTSFFGGIKWHMNVKSDCEDTAFFIRIFFIENGEAYNVTETITSLSHICDNYKPNEQLTIDLETPPAGFTVRKGGRIRVDISSDGTVYVPHSNVKGHWAEVSESKIAQNTVIFDDSYIELKKDIN